LASRVSCSRAHGLRACAKAIAEMFTEVSFINDRFAMTHQLHSTPSTEVAGAVRTTEVAWTVDGADLSTPSHLRAREVLGPLWNRRPSWGL